MLDAALLEKCADPSLTPAIVEQFVAAAGSADPLAITVQSGGRLILVPKPKTSAEAMALVRENVGRAVVRVGITQLPAGVGVTEASELKEELVEPCANLRIGTKMFARILRIVAKWYGTPNAEEFFPQIFEDAVYAWKTGEFEGEIVFRVVDPGGAASGNSDQANKSEEAAPEPEIPPEEQAGPPDQNGIYAAGIRIDLSRIGGQ